MVLHFLKQGLKTVALPGLAWLTLMGQPARAQSDALLGTPVPCSGPAQQTAQAPLGGPAACSPCPSYMPYRPYIPYTPARPATPPTPATPPARPSDLATPSTPQASTTPEAQTEPSLDTGQAGAGEGGSVALAAPGGYLDSAIPKTMFRLRFDAGYDNNRPDRADFFYPQCGCFGPPAQGPGNTITGQARRVDYQEASGYFEYAADPRFSAFFEAPIRWLDIAFARPGVPNDSHGGFSDVNFGFKYALLYEPEGVLTCQLRVYAPSGNASLGLGRNNWNLEPALLAYHRLSEYWILQAEVRDFIPVAASDDFAGNVLRYGIGLSYLFHDSPTFQIAPVGELVGWSVLSGKETSEDGTAISASGDTIVNVKVGVRTYFGNGHDIYVGWGHALTGDRWYKDIVRAEYRYSF